MDDKMEENISVDIRVKWLSKYNNAWLSILPFNYIDGSYLVLAGLRYL